MFDAICVSLGTAGTGGFGNWNDSIAHYDSAYLQNVISVFMILFGINFNAYFLLLTRKFKQLFKIEEIRVYLGVIAVFTTLIAFNVRGCFRFAARELPPFPVSGCVYHHDHRFFNRGL